MLRGLMEKYKIEQLINIVVLLKALWSCNICNLLNTSIVNLTPTLSLKKAKECWIIL
jgi:hypothetical protein